MATKISKPKLVKKSTGKGAPPPAEVVAPEVKKANNLTKLPSTELVALNFTVPAEFRTRFKIFSAMHNMKQVEVLYEAFDEFEKRRT